jgi:hypothetical protein
MFPPRPHPLLLPSHLSAVSFVLSELTIVLLIVRNWKLFVHTINLSSFFASKHGQTMTAFDATDKKYQISQNFHPDKESTWTHPPEKDGKSSGETFKIVATV